MPGWNHKNKQASNKQATRARAKATLREWDQQPPTPQHITPGRSTCEDGSWLLAGALDNGDHGPHRPQLHWTVCWCCCCWCLTLSVVLKVVCLCLYKWIVVRTRVPRLHSTAITWDNWSQTQKMRAEKILKLMPMVDGNQLGPEAWL
jgi:hypothetical protein